MYQLISFFFYFCYRRSIFLSTANNKRLDCYVERLLLLEPKRHKKWIMISVLHFSIDASWLLLLKDFALHATHSLANLFMARPRMKKSLCVCCVESIEHSDGIRCLLCRFVFKPLSTTSNLSNNLLQSNGTNERRWEITKKAEWTFRRKMQTKEWTNHKIYQTYGARPNSLSLTPFPFFVWYDSFFRSFTFHVFTYQQRKYKWLGKV